MAQPMGGRFILGGRGGATYGAQWEAVVFSAAEGATYGATNGRLSHSQRPKAQPMGGHLILGGRGRNLWRNR